MIRSLVFGFAALLAAANPLLGEAAVLLEYDFNRTVANGGLTANFVDEGAFSSASAVTEGNLTVFETNLTSLDPTALVTSPGSTVGGATLATAFTNNWYFQYSFEVASGMTVDLEELSFQAARGGASTNRGFGVTTSLTGHSQGSVISSAANIPTVRETYTSYDVDLTGNPLFQGLTDAGGPITFRFYIFSPADNNQVDFNFVTLSGTAVPEPSSFALLGVGLVGAGAAVQRRARRRAALPTA